MGIKSFSNGLQGRTVLIKSYVFIIVVLFMKIKDIKQTTNSKSVIAKRNLFQVHR